MAQEMQVRYVSAYSFDAKWAGEFEIVMDQITLHEVIKIQRQIQS